MENFTPGVVEGLEVPDDHAPPFASRVVRVDNINFVVYVPPDTVLWFDEPKRPVPVLGLIDGPANAVGVRATIVHTLGGRHAVYLNAVMRRALGVVEGDSVSVTLWSDPSDRSPAVPSDVRDALRAGDVLAEFEALAPSHRREYLVWIDDAKQAATRARRIGQMIDRLGGS